MLHIYVCRHARKMGLKLYLIKVVLLTVEKSTQIKYFCSQHPLHELKNNRKNVEAKVPKLEIYTEVEQNKPDTSG